MTKISDGEAPPGVSATCPRCWFCGGEATKTVVLPNPRLTMLIAVGACAKHEIGAMAELNNLQDFAFRLGGGGA